MPFVTSIDLFKYIIFYIIIFLIFLYSVLYYFKVIPVPATGPLLNISNMARLLALSVGVIMVWKGLYSLIDLHFLSQYPFFGNLTATIIGILIIFLIGGETALNNYFG